MPRLHTDHEWEHTKSEDEYFRRSDAALIDKARQLEAQGRARQLLGQASGIHDSEILDDLARLGFRPETVDLLYLVPLVYVAWSSGSVTRRERELVLREARLRSIDEGSTAYTQLVTWLDLQPSSAFLRDCLHIIRSILKALPPPERRSAADNLIRSCHQIASASRSLLGLGRRVCAGEKEMLGRIALELGEEP